MRRQRFIKLTPRLKRLRAEAAAAAGCFFLWLAALADGDGRSEGDQLDHSRGSC